MHILVQEVDYHFDNVSFRKGNERFAFMQCILGPPKHDELEDCLETFHGYTSPSFLAHLVKNNPRGQNSSATWRTLS
jgi:hypothetical protein